MQVLAEPRPLGKSMRCLKKHGTSPCKLSPLSSRPTLSFVLLQLIWSHSLTRRKINARSVFLGTKYAIAQFLSQPPHTPSQHRGWIINTASMLGLVGLQPSAAAYCASKGAVVLLTKQVAVEYAKDKIHCNALCPGCMTPFSLTERWIS